MEGIFASVSGEVECVFTAKPLPLCVHENMKSESESLIPSEGRLGRMYANGEGVTKSEVEAAKWYRIAAEQGHKDAQFSLGVAYYFGNGVTKDYAEAAKWFRKAADQGDAGAQFNLGVCYENGQGVAQDKAEAANWYRKAANQGNKNAQNALQKSETGSKNPQSKLQGI